MSENRITLDDIATEAGVHKTTVSLALRNHPRLPEETRTRIQALAKTMGYAPDPLLRALIAYRGAVMPRRNPPTIAYVTNWTTRLGWKNVTAHPQFYAGAEAAARSFGYNLEHFWLREPGLTQDALNRTLLTRGINGLIIASHGREMGDALQFDWEKYAAIKIDYFPHKPALHNVTNNQCEVVRLAVRRVIAAGYRRIGLVMHRGWDHAVDNTWSVGFLCEQEALPSKDHVPAHLFPALHPVEHWLDEGKSAVEVEVEAFSKWFEKYRPEVILSKASFVMPAIVKLGLRIPHDVAFADLFLEEPSGVRAGVQQNHKAVGAIAVELLTTQLQHSKFGVPKIPTTTFVEGTWFDGASCPRR